MLIASLISYSYHFYSTDVSESNPPYGYLHKEFTSEDDVTIEFSHLVSGIGNYAVSVNSTVYLNPFSVMREGNNSVYTCKSDSCEISILMISPPIKSNSSRFDSISGSSFKLIGAFLKIFKNKKLFRRFTEDTDYRVYFSTKINDSLDLFASDKEFNTTYFSYYLKRGTYVYHLSQKYISSTYTYSQDGKYKTRIWKDKYYEVLNENEHIEHGAKGSIVPKENVEVKYSFKVQKDEYGWRSGYGYFPPNLSLYIPPGIHTLEEVKEYSQKEKDRDYQKQFDDLYAWLKEEEREHPYKNDISEERDIFGLMYLFNVLIILVAFFGIHYAYWQCHGDDSNLDIILDDM